MAACEQTFGFADGKAYAPDCVVEYTPQPHGLDKVTTHSSRERAFAALWHRAAALRDTDSQQALATVRAWHISPMLQMAPWLATRDEPIDADALGALIAESPDPLAAVYTYLVPSRLTREQFVARISPLEQRKLDLNIAERRSLWSRLRRANLI